MTDDGQGAEGAVALAREGLGARGHGAGDLDLAVPREEGQHLVDRAVPRRDARHGGSERARVPDAAVEERRAVVDDEDAVALDPDVGGLVGRGGRRLGRDEALREEGQDEGGGRQQASVHARAPFRNVRRRRF